MYNNGLSHIYDIIIYNSAIFTYYDICIIKYIIYIAD